MDEVAEALSALGGRVQGVGDSLSELEKDVSAVVQLLKDQVTPDAVQEPWGEEEEKQRQQGGAEVLLAILFAHELWLALQHLNVLMNPFCQNLDRQYGIALLKRRMYWVIASVLSAYWLREVVSLLLALHWCRLEGLTYHMALVSVVYHLAKITLISLDARKKWSGGGLGIMRILIDHWHVGTLPDILVSIKRVFLQGFDTLVHVLVLRDMAAADSSGILARRVLWPVALVWALHAVANMLTKLSTATLVVELAKWALTGGKNKKTVGGRAAGEKSGASGGWQRQSNSRGGGREWAGSDVGAEGGGGGGGGGGAGAGRVFQRGNGAGGGGAWATRGRSTMDGAQMVDSMLAAMTHRGAASVEEGGGAAQADYLWEGNGNGNGNGPGKKEEEEQFACTSSCEHAHRSCIVCHLLTENQPKQCSKRH